MDLNDIPLFLHVVDAGSFTAAAQSLGREKSSVSRSIARLEEELGVRLIQRTTRKLGLTDAGQAFYDRARGAVAGLEDAAIVVQELGSEPRGTVRVSSVPDSGVFSISSHIAAFVAKYPKIHVELIMTGRFVDLVAEGIDLAIRAGKLSDSTLVAKRIGTVGVGIFAAPSYLDARGRPAALSDLAEHDCVLFRGRGPRATWTLIGPSGKKESVEVKGRITTDDLGFVARVAAEGAGIAALPFTVASVLAEEGKLEHVLQDYRDDAADLHLVQPSAAFVPARVTLLRDFLFERMSRQIAESVRQCDAHDRAKNAGKRARTR